MALSKLLGVAFGACLPFVFAFPPALGQANDQERARIAGVYDASAEALEAMRAALDLTAFDVAAVSKTLSGQSPKALRDWVDSHITLMPYRGALKGAQGALEDRRANSLDRALLLAAILKDQGVEVRLARAALDDATAAKLQASLSQGAGVSEAVVGSPDDQILEKLYADPRVDGAKMRARTAAETTQRTARLDAANARIKTISDALTSQLAPLLPAPADPAADARAALADHWWVEVQSGGSWTGLDPSEGIVGALTATANVAPDALPEDARHILTVRVLAEFWQDGAFREAPLLSKSFDAATIHGKTVRLRERFLNMRALDAIAADGGDFDANIIAATAKASAWVPILFVGDDVFTDQLVSTNGDVVEANDANMAKYGGQGGQGMSGMGDSIGGVLGGLGDEMSGKEPHDEDTGAVKLTAMMLEFELRAPGQPARIERRSLFDAAGAAARSHPAQPPAMTAQARTARGLALLDAVDAMAFGGRVSYARVAGRMQENYALAFRAFSAWMKGGQTAPMPDMPGSFQTINVPLNVYASSRGDFGADGGGREVRALNIAMMRDGLRLGADGTSIAETRIFDIVANPVWTASQASAIGAGVADTVTETEAAGVPDNARNAAVRYAEALGRGEAWTVVKPGDEAGLAALGATDEIAALMKADMARGYLVVAPRGIARSEDAAWWRVNPATGETLGMTAGGGAVTTEYVITNAIAIANMGSCLYKVGKAPKDASNTKLAANAICVLGGAVAAAGVFAGFWIPAAIGGAGSVAGNLLDP